MRLTNEISLDVNKRLTDEDVDKLEELCDWIEKNINQIISWKQLTQHTGWQHSDLIHKFLLYKETTPMAYIHELKKKKPIGTVTKFLPQISTYLIKKNRQ